MKKTIITASLLVLGACSQDRNDKCLDDQNWGAECKNGTEPSDTFTDGEETRTSGQETDTDTGDTMGTDGPGASTETEEGSTGGECKNSCPFPATTTGQTTDTNGSTDSESDTSAETEGNSSTTGTPSHSTCTDSTNSDTTSTDTTTEEENKCGDGSKEDLEECDDGNTVDGDGCSSDCKKEIVCGNGIVEGKEECDDGNDNDSDGCSNTCVDTRHEICKDKSQILILDSEIRNHKTTGVNNYCDGDPKCGNKMDDWNGLCAWYRFEGDAGTKMLDYAPEDKSCGAKYSGWYKGETPTKVSPASTKGKICFGGKNFFGVYKSCLFYTPTEVVMCEDGKLVYKLNNIPQKYCNAVHCGQ